MENLNTQLNTKKIAFANHVLASAASEISPRLREKAANRQVRFVDACIAVKTLISTQPTQSLLDKKVNNSIFPGIVDFTQGKLSTIYGTGAAAIEGLIVRYAPKVADDAVEEKVFKSTGFPADLEHAWIEISQKGNLLCAVKLSRFTMHGDSPQAIYDNVFMLGTPFVLADDVETKIELKRPDGVVGAAEGYLSVEAIGMQVVA